MAGASGNGPPKRSWNYHGPASPVPFAGGRPIVDHGIPRPPPQDLEPPSRSPGSVRRGWLRRGLMAALTVGVLVLLLVWVRILPGLPSAPGPSTAPTHVPAYYYLTINQRGVPLGWSWDAELNGTNYGSITGSPDQFYVLNGTYTYAVSSPGYVAYPSSGSVLVAGGPVTVNVTFQLPP